MPAIILPDRWRRQPSGHADLASGLARLYVGYTRDAGLYEVSTRSFNSNRGFFTPVGTSQGLALAPSSNDKTVYTGVPSVTIYSAIFVFDVRTASITGTTGGATLCTGIQDETSTGNPGIYFGSSTGTIADETITIISTGSGRTAIKDTLAVGPHILCFHWNGTKYEIWLDGQLPTQYDGSGGAAPLLTIAPYLGGRNLSGEAWVCPVAFALSPTPDVDLRAYQSSPFGVLRKNNIVYFPSAGGGGATITGSGTPTAQSSTVAGTAERSVTGTGTPTAQASAVAGVAERVITSSGTPTAQSSTVSGTGTVGGAFTGSGTLQAQSATVSGTAERSVTGTGAPASQAATVSGTAERVVTGTGTPTSQSSTVSGTGQVGNVVTGSGSPTAQAATVSGTAERTVTSSGALSAQSSTVAGTAERTITGSGALSAQSSTVYGFDSTPVDTGVRRIYPAGGARIDREINEWFQKNEDTAHAKRLMREDEELVLILLALAA